MTNLRNGEKGKKKSIRRNKKVKTQHFPSTTITWRFFEKGFPTFSLYIYPFFQWRDYFFTKKEKKNSIELFSDRRERKILFRGGGKVFFLSPFHRDLPPLCFPREYFSSQTSIQKKKALKILESIEDVRGRHSSLPCSFLPFFFETINKAVIFVFMTKQKANLRSYVAASINT